MESMVSHMSVSDCGGNLPYPMHNMWDMAWTHVEIIHWLLATTIIYELSYMINLFLQSRDS